MSTGIRGDKLSTKLHWARTASARKRYPVSGVSLHTQTRSSLLLSLSPTRSGSAPKCRSRDRYAHRSLSLKSRKRLLLLLPGMLLTLFPLLDSLDIPRRAKKKSSPYKLIRFASDQCAPGGGSLCAKQFLVSIIIVGDACIWKNVYASAKDSNRKKAGIRDLYKYWRRTSRAYYIQTSDATSLKNRCPLEWPHKRILLPILSRSWITTRGKKL